MKKNISINLQGLIFHIEEDGYEVLGRYLAEVRSHFSNYRGHEEIVADIESRIAELFSVRISTNKQVITLADVQEMVAKMGRVSDFQSADEAEEEEEALAGGATAYSEYTANGTATMGATTSTDTEPKRLYRDMANRKIAGVAAGLARYFSTNPLWFRLGFLALFIALPILFDDTRLEDVGGKFAGLAFISYIVLWIALPKRYDTTPANEDPTFRKLYRDTDNGKVGGVSAGLAAYFKTDVVLFRILFVVFVFAGGFALPLYIILWILLPEAKSVSDKMRMRGDAVTLSSIDNSLRSNALDGDGASSSRPVGTFLEELFRNLRPLFAFLGTAIRWFVGAMLVVIGFSMLLGFTVALGVALGVLPESQGFIHTGPFPAYLFTNGVPAWSLLAFFLVAGIPALAMLLLGLGLLLRRSVMTRTTGLSLLGLWLLSVVGSTMAGVRISREFQDEGTYSTTRKFAPIPYPTIVLQTHDFSEGMASPRITLVSADSGEVVRMEQEVSARGVNETAAIETAANSVTYGVQQRDSVLTFDESVRFKPGAMFRDQKISLVLHLPKGKTYRLSRDFAYLLDDNSFVNDHRPEDVEKRRFRLRGNQLECLLCTPEDLGETEEGTANNEEGSLDIDTGDDYRIRVGTDKNKDGDIDIKVDVEQARFSGELNDYGSGRRTFNENGFSRIEASGAYRVYVRQGSEFKVEAAGDERDLRDLRVDTDGDRLVIRNRNSGSWFNFSKSNRNPVLIRVEVPTLRSLDLSGACRADVAGFSQEAMSVDQSGATAAILDVNVPRIDLDLSGACRADLRGRVKDLRAEGSGACQIQALDLQAESANLELSGVSRARVRVANELRTDLSGACQVDYAGNPTEVKNETSGSSRVKHINE